MGELRSTEGRHPLCKSERRYIISDSTTDNIINRHMRYEPKGHSDSGQKKGGSLINVGVLLRERDCSSEWR